MRGGREGKGRNEGGLGIDRESKVTNAKVIVPLSHQTQSEFIGYRATTRSLFHARQKQEEEKRRGG